MSNTDTRNYPTQTRNSNSGRRHSQPPRRRGRGKRTFLIVVIIILLAIVAVALFFVGRDIVLAEREKRNQQTGSSAITTEGAATTAPVSDPSVPHTPDMIIDGQDETYMRSDNNQAVGEYVIIEFGTSVQVSNVRIVSNSATEYIRKADVQTSEDGENWTYFAQYTGSPNNAEAKTVTKGTAVHASFLRIILVEKADAKWVLNSVYVDTNETQGIQLLKAEAGKQQSTVVTEDPTGTTTKTNPTANTISKNNADIYTGSLILINSNHKYVFPTSTADIISLYSCVPKITIGTKSSSVYKIGGSALPALQADALNAFNSMAVAFAKETNITNMFVGASDAWRSSETQAGYFASDPAGSLPAGYSEHNTGLAMNIKIMDAEEKWYRLDYSSNIECVKTYTWLTSNAYKYGFIERFKSSKKAITKVTDDYHYRYVGIPHAYYMSQNNLCLEEYIEKLHTFTYEGTHLDVNVDGTNYEIYFVPLNKNGSKTEIPVPADYPYTISGDNYSGFIVTITK